MKNKVITFETTKKFINNISISDFKDSDILLKGSRKFRFEEISDFLQKKNHKTYLEVNLESLKYNFNYIKSKLNPATKIMIMVKANAYGFGIEEVSKILQNIGVDYLGVAYTDEGILLRDKGIYKPIMVMNPNKEDFEKIIENNLEPVIYDINSLKFFLEIIKKNIHKKGYKIHLEFDTGMHRLGFYKEDIDSIASIIENNVDVVSIFSHLSESDNVKNKKFTKKQINLFEEIIKEMKMKTNKTFITHILNSSGILNYIENQMNMVRVGLNLYGISEDNNFKPVGKLKSIISQIKEVKKGDSISYNRNFIAQQNKKIAVIPIGYADGFSRHFSNKKNIIKVNNQKVDILGDICMDTTMVDISDINCDINSEVSIFEFDYNIIDIAKKICTISYELIATISERVKRLYIYED